MYLYCNCTPTGIRFFFQHMLKIAKNFFIYPIWKSSTGSTVDKPSMVDPSLARLDYNIKPASRVDFETQSLDKNDNVAGYMIWFRL